MEEFFKFLLIITVTRTKILILIIYEPNEMLLFILDFPW